MTPFAMSLEPPSWWYRDKPLPLIAWGLWPVSKLYGAAVQARFFATTPYRSPLPVICIGNFTLGGAGKTPLALKLAGLLREAGRRPCFLTRGYGGREDGPHVVDPATDRTEDVGDEPLLLAKAATTVVSRRRPAGAQFLETFGCDLILMDDGFQNPSLHKDFCVIVVDAGAGIGSGKVFPLGPLRAPLNFQMAMADAVVLLSTAGDEEAALPRFNVPVFRAEIVPELAPGLGQRPLVAFCGIGRPQKFYGTLQTAGFTIVKRFSFPDHHGYSEADASMLLNAAKAADATLITTEKDHVRLKLRTGALKTLHDEAFALPIKVRFLDADETNLMQLLEKKISARS